MDKLSNEDRLIRYMDCAKLLHLIHNKKLYFPRADCFDDKHEGYYTKQVYDISKSIFVEVDGKSSNEGLLEHTKRIRESAYVSCWMKSQHESMAHWEIYGGKNSVAIVTSVEELRNQINQASANEGILSLIKREIHEVRYIDHNEIDDELAKELLSDSINPLKMKNIAFKYEDEVRVIFNHLHQPLAKSDFNKKLGKGFDIDIKPKELIKSIIISPKADKWFFSLVHDLMESYKLSDLVKWSKLHLTPFEASVEK